MSCGVACRHGSDLALLWLWHRPAAIAPIRPLAWEPSYVAGVAPEGQNTKKKKKKERKKRKVGGSPGAQGSPWLGEQRLSGALQGPPKFV